MTHVVVIGGGVTGCGIARDLSMRGATVTLVERDSLNAGTSSRSHNMLHSGARYADVDPAAAIACNNEAAILKRIGGGAIKETNGVFVVETEADHQYIDKKRSACRSVGIPVEEITNYREFRESNPGITDTFDGIFRVPDGVILPDALVGATIQSAASNGATVRCDTEVTSITVQDQTATDVVIRESGSGTKKLAADFVVNATGPWANEVAGLAGGTVKMALTRGTIMEFSHSGIQEVINRCRPPSDGDILVPAEQGVLAGTTSVPVNSPRDREPTETEISTILQQAAAVLPDLSQEQCTRVYSGIRPLYSGFNGGGERKTSRQYQLIDHTVKDGIDRFVSVVGGKFTTHRLMAEQAGDHIAERTPIDATSQTATTPLPGPKDTPTLDEIMTKYF